MDIENPIVHNDDRNVNNYREPKIIGYCAYSKEPIHYTDYYTKLDSGEMFADDISLVYWLIDNGLLERFNY